MMIYNYYKVRIQIHTETDRLESSLEITVRLYKLRLNFAFYDLQMTERLHNLLHFLPPPCRSLIGIVKLNQNQ